MKILISFGDYKKKKFLYKSLLSDNNCFSLKYNKLQLEGIKLD